MDKLRPYLEKAKPLLDHLEKVVLLGALGVLGYFTLTKFFDNRSKVEEIIKDAPTSRGEIRIGGDMLSQEDVSTFHASLDAATNANKTPRLELLKGISNHYLFSPEVWLTNRSLGIFRSDDGERKRGLEAMSVVGPPRSLYMRIWGEVRLNGNGNVVNHFITIQDECLRYQTTNQMLHDDPRLHAFLPTTNLITLATNVVGTILPRNSLVPLNEANEPYVNWVDWTGITSAGFVDKLHTNRFLRTWDVFPDKFEKRILKHPDPRALKAFEEEYTRRGVADPTLYDPTSHPERLVVHFYERVDGPGTGRHFFKMKLYLHPATNVVHFGGDRFPQGLPAVVLREDQKEGSSVNFVTDHVKYFERGEFIDLEYGRGTNHRILFPACKPGRKLFIDGSVYIVEAINQTHVVLGKDPELTPGDDPTRSRKYFLPIPGLALPPR
ncbi:MAG: hypothetical protein QF685_02500 [Verrucomicrobiota bacterium]|jgi:hypothetical protein|nr:hypothetical protein [Verrucomicrobiota bacterium]